MFTTIATSSSLVIQTWSILGHLQLGSQPFGFTEIASAIEFSLWYLGVFALTLIHLSFFFFQILWIWSVIWTSVTYRFNSVLLVHGLPCPASLAFCLIPLTLLQSCVWCWFSEALCVIVKTGGTSLVWEKWNWSLARVYEDSCNAKVKWLPQKRSGVYPDVADSQLALVPHYFKQLLSRLCSRVQREVPVQLAAGHAAGEVNPVHHPMEELSQVGTQLGRAPWGCWCCSKDSFPSAFPSFFFSGRGL